MRVRCQSVKLSFALYMKFSGFRFLRIECSTGAWDIFRLLQLLLVSDHQCHPRVPAHLSFLRRKSQFRLRLVKHQIVALDQIHTHAPRALRALKPAYTQPLPGAAVLPRKSVVRERNRVTINVKIEVGQSGAARV